MTLEGMQIGHYRLQKLIGSGGMGEVYLAQDTRIVRQVAIKVVKNEAVSYPDARELQEMARLFQREMKAIAALDHPNILPLIDFGEQTGDKVTFSYMIMPFRPDGSLVDWLHRRNNSGILPPQDVVHIILQAAGALQHAHTHGLIHLDVKPPNFLIRQREDRPDLPDVLLADFGISKFNTATITASQSIRGMPAYMAPEQWSGSPVAATDQYALAVMAYQLLTGKFPFQGSMQQVMYQHLQGTPRPPSSINAHIPAAVDAVILGALAKKPEERFPSVQAFATAFEQAWSGTGSSDSTMLRLTQRITPPVQPQPPTIYPPSPAPAGRPGSKIRRRWIIASIGTIVLLALVAAGIISQLPHNSSPNKVAVNGPGAGSSSSITSTVPNPGSSPTIVLTTSPDGIPQLKSSYRGTYTPRGSPAQPLTILVRSQSQANIVGEVDLQIDATTTKTCQLNGVVTQLKEIMFGCIFGQQAEQFTGSVYPDGHMAGNASDVSSNLLAEWTVS